MTAALYENGMFKRYMEIPFRMNEVLALDMPPVSFSFEEPDAFYEVPVKRYRPREKPSHKHLWGETHYSAIHFDGPLAAFIYDLYT